MKVLLFGDGEWARSSLQRLLESGHKCAGVVLRTNPSDPALSEFAEAAGIRVLVPHNVNEGNFVHIVEQLQADLSLSIAHNQIFRRPLIDGARLGCINFHAGMLPRYRGRNVINWAIINGETEIGLTAHFVDEGIDTGDIVLQRVLPLLWTDTYGEVLRRVVAAFPDLVIDTLSVLASGKVPRKPQDHARATYMPGRSEGDEVIDWNATSRRIYNLIRGISRPAPGAATVLGNRRVILWRAYYEPSWPSYVATAGTVVNRLADGVVVKTGDSTIRIQEAEVEGESPGIPRWRIGTRLGGSLLMHIADLERRILDLERDGQRGRSRDGRAGDE